MATLIARLVNRLLLNSSRIYLERYNRDFARSMKAGARMLDAGAGNAPYKKLFQHVEYESADFEQVDKPYAKSTYVCDLCERIPVADGRFDYIVFNQTMEHLRDPGKALSELFRVLAPGGRIICTVPLFYEEHEQPFDFFRYTRFAHRYLFTQAGFEVERIEWLEGFFGTCGYMFQVMSRYLPARLQGARSIAFLATPFLVIIKTLSLFAAAVFYRLDLYFKVTHLGFPKNYVIFAGKPDGQTVL
jgi:SAM-dependent methyltransferase